MVTCINLAVVWIFLFYRYSNFMLTYGLYMNLHLDDAIIKDRLIFNIQDISNLKYFVRWIPVI